MNIEIEDRIYWFYSRKAKRAYPVYVFGGDTDMATQGKGSLTSLERDEVVITTMTGDEWNDSARFGIVDQFEDRINACLGRQDLRCRRLRKLQGTLYDLESLDIYDPKQPAEQRGKERIASFLRRGGRITGVGEPVTQGSKPLKDRRRWSRVLFALWSLIPLGAGFLVAIRFGLLMKRGCDKYGWDFSNSVPRFAWKTAEGWVDLLELLGHMLLLGVCLGIGYWILRRCGRHERDILRGPEGVLFYTLSIGSILAMILYPRLTQ